MIDIMLLGEGKGKGNAARNSADAAYECEVDLEYYLRHGPQGINAAAGRAAAAGAGGAAVSELLLDLQQLVQKYSTVPTAVPVVGSYGCT